MPAVGVEPPDDPRRSGDEPVVDPPGPLDALWAVRWGKGGREEVGFGLRTWIESRASSGWLLTVEALKLWGVHFKKTRHCIGYRGLLRGL